MMLNRLRLIVSVFGCQLFPNSTNKKFSKNNLEHSDWLEEAVDLMKHVPIGLSVHQSGMLARLLCSEFRLVALLVEILEFLID